MQDDAIVILELLRRGPETYLLLGNRLFTLSSSGRLVCIYGDFDGWIPPDFDLFISENVR